MTSTILLPTNTVTLTAPVDADSHGWVLPPPDAPTSWSGPGSIQLAFGTASSGADSGGGSGPFRPQTTLAGTGFLPQEAQPREGMVAGLEDGRSFVISACRWVPDPTGGALGCWAINLTTLGAH